MKRTLMTVALGGLLCCASAHAQCCAPSPAANSKSTVNPAATATDGKVALKITGMTCDKCAAAVKKSLTQLKGVNTADVNLDKGSAVVTFDSTQVKSEQLIAAVDKAGGDRHTFKAEKAEK